MNKSATKDEDGVTRKVLFQLHSGCSPWAMHEVESDTIAEKDLLAWTKDCVLHHTGRALTKKEWQLFTTNGELRRRDGNLLHSFTFSRYSIA